jgi:hypothetical protein
MNPRNWLRWMLFDNSVPRLGNQTQSLRLRRLRTGRLFPRLETLDDRLAPAAISISDASAIEGNIALKFLDRFVDGSGGGLNARGSTFGPDGNGDGAPDFYVASGGTNQILRFDGRTGSFLDVFVASGSGGLTQPLDPAFGPGGMLYVSGGDFGGIFRYDSTGTFVDNIASGLSNVGGLTFGNDGSLYIADRSANQIMRYNGSRSC